MDEKQDIVTSGDWYIPRGYRSKLKWYGVNIQKGFIVFAAFMFALNLQTSLFPPEQIFNFILFVFLFTLLAFYLVLPTRAGGTNANAIWYFLTHRKKKYYSIDRNIYPEFGGSQRTQRQKRFK